MSDKIIKTRICDNQALATTGVFTSVIFDVRSAKIMIGVRVQPSGGGAPDFKIDIAWSDYLPLPQMPASWLVTPQPDPDNFETNILTSWNTTYGAAGPLDWHNIAFPVNVPLDTGLQIRFTGINVNPATTAITAKLITQESL